MKKFIILYILLILLFRFIIFLLDFTKKKEKEVLDKNTDTLYRYELKLMDAKMKQLEYMK